MSADLITPQKIAICALVCLLTIVAFRFMLGDKRDLYFKRSDHISFITLRGMFHDAVALGYPRNLIGAVIWLALIAVLAFECAVIVLLF